MNKTPRPMWLLSKALSVVTVFLFLAGVAGCGPQQGDGDHGKPPINEDTLRNHVIPIGLAIQYTKGFQAALDSNYHLRPKVLDSLRFSHGEEFPSDVFYDLLSQTNPKQGSAKGIRIYFGRGSDGQFKLVMVPVDSLGNDMIDHLVNLKGKAVPGTAHVESLTVSDGQGFEVGQQCPTACDNGGSGLNQ